MSDFRILVTGSRDWADEDTIYDALYPYFDNKQAVLVHGDCPRGADNIADGWWSPNALGPVEAHPADWENYGRAAGYRRNAEMVALGADICLAFQRNGSKGTQHTIDLARKAGIPVRVYTEDDANGMATNQQPAAPVPSAGDDPLSSGSR